MEEARLTLEDKRALLSHARHALEVRLGAVTNAQPAGDKAALTVCRGAFVTLTRRGRLRGCIGTFRCRTTLLEVVHEMALSAALHDPRFHSVQKSELPEIEIEISALTPLREITAISEIEVGVHGIYITKGAWSGVLLPQVAVEYGWTREEFLDQTCVKAGLPPDAWRNGATIEVFSAEVFSESDNEGSKVSCGS